jgi:mannose-6-phosphate isomerase
MTPTELDLPLRFEPYLRPMVWGGRRLGTLLGKPLPDGGTYGESWEISDHPSHPSVVATGPWAGRTLQELMQTQKQALLGAAKYDVFPWLVKFLDACDWLSVQVHPNEEAVRRLLPGEGSKTEAWFVIDAQPGSRVYAGLRPGVDDKRLRQALADGSVTSCLHQFEPKPGECVFLPAGTVHAVGGGVLLAEVQQTSDATFRLYDWDRRDSQGRSRPLHVEQSFASINWNQRPVQPVQVRGYDQDIAIDQELVRCPYFELRYLRSRRDFAVGSKGRLQAVIVLDGQANWRTDSTLETMKRGEAWVIPAVLPSVDITPRSRLDLLIITLPVE